MFIVKYILISLIFSITLYGSSDPLKDLKRNLPLLFRHELSSSKLKQSPLKWLRHELDREIFNHRISIKLGPLDKSIEYIADHTIPSVNTKPIIRIRQYVYDDKLKTHRHISYEELWSAIVFEIYNIRNHQEFSKIYNEALIKEVSENEWDQKNKQIEYSALKKLNLFYQTIWKPWSQELRLNNMPELWRGDVRNTSFKEWYKKNNYKYWRDYHKKNLAPYYHRQKGKSK
jgi:hypothetical protein